ncbi:RsmB/NOP family class I SAM-dependent RNA methyltransferase [Oligoflexus tunisiensis]|uniref:RsmB/NOP family class I SAM-dependent RNA methyltransferase n=1 Tax=Oligoflexus tunisiensis TaxID=708132 RepID=UPI000AE08522|nr:RsmB/NOP family class I SAM-dependent RNA methyltransferase [Oligoflexus tunisiensis]
MSISPQFQRYRDICPDWPAFVASLEKPLPTTLWVNTRAIPSAALLDLMPWPQESVQPLSWRPDAFRVPEASRPGTQPEYLAGFYHLQEEVSMIPPLLLDPQPGERVLDLCAAPGNKTMQIALAMQNQGTVVGHDWNFNRLRILRSHSQRLGLSIISTALGNGAHFKGADGFFDRVLVDAPCSCEGTVRKNPRIMYHQQQPGALLYNGIQLAILQRAVEACRPGGRIVYSTCTFRPEENEVVIDRILKAHPDLDVLPVVVPGLNHSSGLTAFEQETFDPRVARALRIWPHQNDSGGFFICVLVKGPGPAYRLPLRKTEDQVGINELAFLQERFDFPAAIWDTHTIFHRTPKKLSYHPVPHEIPETLRLEELGQNFMKINFQFPKLSTAAARIWGLTARKNRVHLNRTQFMAYAKGEDLFLSEAEASDIESDGYVIALYAGAVMGLGLVQRREGVYRLRSLFPRDWSQLAEPLKDEE